MCVTWGQRNLNGNAAAGKSTVRDRYFIRQLTDFDETLREVGAYMASNKLCELSNDRPEQTRLGLQRMVDIGKMRELRAYESPAAGRRQG